MSVRIALVTDAWKPQVNGVVTTLGHVVRELEGRGHSVQVVHPGLFRTVPCPRYPQIRLALLPGRGTAQRLDEWSPEAVHIATEGPLGIAARRWCRRRRRPFTTSWHTQFPLYLRAYAGVPEAWSYRFLRWFHGAAERTLVPTESVRRELAERGFTGVRTWTRGVEHDLFRPRPRGFFPFERPILLYAGRVAAEKNIEAFLALRHPGTKVVVGDGPILPRLRERHPDAVFTGFRHGEELARHFADADVFVFPSRTDTFGVVMLEAMACGVPVAALPVTGPRDVVREGVSGALDEDLDAAVARALRCDRAATSAYARGFSWERCADLFLENLATSNDAVAGAGSVRREPASSAAP
ncbi:MAG TPA: glycosyltransferase family 1 protein [Phycisphaerales bacterium]|nr:glycosyltransferase family 1 protein [Phycisphaerales bacterium]HMP38436.1 glycosyltransferase family 1 protein [Phycisphaerales bacterium]